MCEALAHFDVRDRLHGIQDVATPPRSLMALAECRCRYVELGETAHLAPAEQPDLIADALLASTQRSPL